MSTPDAKSDEKLIYKLIVKKDNHSLKEHLLNKESVLNLTEIYDKQGYSPLHFATFKNSYSAVKVLLNFLIGEHKSHR